MADKQEQRVSYRDRNGLKNRLKHLTDSRTTDAPPINLTGKSGVILLGVAILAIIGLVFGMWKMLSNPPMDTEAYKDRLVSVNQGDLPAPPFIGWEQRGLEEPPQPLQTNSAIHGVNIEECTPGGKRQADAAGLIMNNATRWSGTELYNTAYNASIRIDASNAYDRSDGRDGGLDYGLIDSFLHDCSYVEFTQDADNESKTVRITRTPMAMEPETWGMSEGRAWAETIAVTTPQGYSGATTTITTIGHGPGATLQGQLTFEGRVDDNSVNTMDLLWTAQTAKAIEKQ